MEMEIIMLTGKPNKGKTAALHFVQEILIATDGVKTTFVTHIGSKDQRDFSTVLKYGRKTIRIFTMGDVEDEDAAKALKKALEDKKYNFLICACNNSKFFKDLKSKEPYLIEIKKTVAKGPFGKLEANWYDAFRIIKLLEEKIGDAGMTGTRIA